ncbi:MAG: hypothetical protein ABH883_07255 [Candidatus Omnitrophota bacterium]
MPDNEEILENIITDFESQKEKAGKKIKQVRKGIARAKILRSLFYAAGLFCIIILAVHTGYMSAKYAGILEKARLWYSGVEKAGDYKLAECAGNMWEVRRAVDSFYARNRRFPVVGDDMYRKEYMPKGITCPASGEKYILKNKDGKVVFCCPNPEKHGVSEIWCDVKSGAPVVERKN